MNATEYNAAIEAMDDTTRLLVDCLQRLCGTTGIHDLPDRLRAEIAKRTGIPAVKSRSWSGVHLWMEQGR